MNIRLIRSIVILILLMCFGGSLAAQQAADPVPYTEEEFPEWMLDLRRGEIIAVGAFPFMLFFTGFGYDLYRFVGNGFSESYRPWPFKTAASEPLKDDERIVILSVSAGLSVVLAVVDYVLGKADEKRQAERREVEERRQELSRQEISGMQFKPMITRETAVTR